MYIQVVWHGIDQVPKEIKKKMKRYNIDWSKEIRTFIEERVRALELLEVLDGVEKNAGERKMRVDSTVLIRESREER